MQINAAYKENTQLLDREFQINIFECTSNDSSVVNLHWHDHLELIFMHEGHAVVYIGNQYFDALPGDIFLVSRGKLHAVYPVDNAFVRLTAIVFNQSLLFEVPDPLISNYILPIIDSTYSIPENKIRQSLQDNNIFSVSLEILLQEFTNRLPGYQLKVKAYLISLIVDIFRDFNPTEGYNNSAGKYDPNTERIKKLLTQIYSCGNVRMSVQEAATFVNLSPYYFCKVFKKVTGRTFIEYINLYRVNKAEELLKKTSMPIAEVADKLGFCSINYFDRTFKKYKRCSPSHCRKANNINI